MGSIGGVDDGPQPTGYGCLGRTFNEGGIGVLGQSSNQNKSGHGVEGASYTSSGVFGHSDTGAGVEGKSNSHIGVRGSTRGAEFDPNMNNVGVYGRATDGNGVFGHSDTNYGVDGYTNGGFTAVRGYSDRTYGVHATSNRSYGLYATSYNAQRAALLDGNVTITHDLRIIGTTIKEGGGQFRIDHPLDPANKYLSHSFVESPDMKNVYDGVVTLDDKGEAEIELPDWFGALNKDFRYQLTAIGGPGPNLYISEEISSDGVAAATTTTNSSNSSNSNKNNNINSRFKVAGGTPGMKVSWQVTGIRKDPWANAHRISVEEDKPDKERGYYTYPELYGQPEDKGIISHLLVPEIERAAAPHK
jgi:hypothetical protein